MLKLTIAEIADRLPTNLQITGLVVDIDGVMTDRPFTWGNPWTVVKVEPTHYVHEHEHNGRTVQASQQYKLHCIPVGDDKITNALPLGDYEGVLCAAVTSTKEI
jgi:hypothetical protein